MPTAPATRTPLSKRQIPTLLGLGILIVSLVAGLLMFGEGTGVFSPRATPETTPKNVRVTNLTDKSFSIVFYTDENTNSFVKYGADSNSIKNQATDDRDQLSGTVGNYRLHHVTVRNLTPNTTYHYYLGTGSTSRFDNNGLPFIVKTLPSPSGAPPVNKTIYGTATTQAGGPAEGSIVFVSAEGVGEMSTVIKSSGSWALALSNARKLDGTGYSELPDESQLNFTFQSIEPLVSTTFSTTVSGSQPVPEVVIGNPGPSAEALLEPEGNLEGSLETSEESVLDTAAELLTDQLDSSAQDSNEPRARFSDFFEETSDELSLDELAVETAVEVLDLYTVSPEEKPMVVTQPIIKGRAIPGIQVIIEVHSETQIYQTLTADPSGEFVLNLLELQKTLEPGEHTVTFRYTDPVTQQEVVKTQSFMVQGTVRQLAESTSPFGSGNPFPLQVTPSPTSAATPAATPTVATRSAIVSTESGTFKSGSVGNTIALIVGGLFFMFAGTWSWWLAHEAREEES